MSSNFHTSVGLLASCRFLTQQDRDAEAETELLGPLVQVREALSVQSPPLDEACALGVPAICFQILSAATNPKVLFETAWIATNIASGEFSHTQAIIRAQCHLPIVMLLTHPDIKVGEQAAWTIGNIAGEGAAIRDILLAMRCSNGCTLFEQLVAMYDAITEQEVVTKELKWSTKAVVVWVLSNLCRGKPQPALDLLRPCFPFLRRVIREAVEWKPALVDAMWTVSYISDGSNDRIQEVLTHNLLKECVDRLLFLPKQHAVVRREHDYMQGTSVLPPELLAGVFEFLPTSDLKNVAFGCKDWFYDVVCHDVDLYARARSALTDDKTIESVVLRILGNVVTGNDAQTEQALQLGFLDIVEQMAKKHAETKFRKELCWSLSNVTAGNSKQVMKVLARQRIVDFVLKSLQLSQPEELSVVREAAWVVSNSCQGADDKISVIRNGWTFGLLIATYRFKSDLKLGRVACEGLEQLLSERGEEEEEGDEDEEKEEEPAEEEDGSSDGVHVEGNPATAAAGTGDTPRHPPPDGRSAKAPTASAKVPPAATSAREMFHEGVTMLGKLSKQSSSAANLVEVAMAKFPRAAFASVRSFYYMIFLPFVKVVLNNGTFDELVDEAEWHDTLQSVLEGRSEEVEHIRADFAEQRAVAEETTAHELRSVEDGEEDEEEWEDCSNDSTSS